MRMSLLRRPVAVRLSPSYPRLVVNALMRDTLDVVSSDLFPGQRVRLPGRPDWGTGQVQSVAGDRVTVNFENAGKVTLRLSGVALDVLEDGPG
jgi:hypothetical protein